MADLCREYGISRKTGYKWVARFKEEGLGGLSNRSRRRHKHPNATPEEMVEAVIGARRKFPTWGPRKLQAWLKGRGYEPPAASTIGKILKREGFVRPRRRKTRGGEFSAGLTAQDQPNAVWAADFKGWFRLKTGRPCYPLTISDGFSRYLLRCHALAHPDAMGCREVFESVFSEFGLPDVLRTDNGTPFSGKHGISALSVWWIKLGIRPERIRRGKPTENGRHERIHRTLKADAIKSQVQSVMFRQQRVFDRFRHIYNDERPHEALGMKTPSRLYTPSNRRFPRNKRAMHDADRREALQRHLGRDRLWARRGRNCTGLRWERRHDHGAWLGRGRRGRAASSHHRHHEGDAEPAATIACSIHGHRDHDYCNSDAPSPVTCARSVMLAA